MMKKNIMLMKPKMFSRSAVKRVLYNICTLPGNSNWSNKQVMFVVH